MTTTPLSFKQTIWHETNGHCVYCGQEIKSGERSMDHVVPVCRGGKGSLDNLVPACKSCNHRRGLVYPPHVLAHPDWIEYVKAKENGHFDSAALKAAKNMRQLYKTKNATEKVMAFFDDNNGSVRAGPEGIRIVFKEKTVALLSWKDVGRQFCNNFNSTIPQTELPQQ